MSTEPWSPHILRKTSRSRSWAVPHSQPPRYRKWTNSPHPQTALKNKLIIKHAGKGARESNHTPTGISRVHPNTAHDIWAELPQRRKPNNINTAPLRQSSGKGDRERREDQKPRPWPAGKHNLSGKERKFLDGMSMATPIKQDNNSTGRDERRLLRPKEKVESKNTATRVNFCNENTLKTKPAGIMEKLEKISDAD